MREDRFPWGLGLILVLVIVGGLGFWLGSSSASPVIIPVAAPAAPAAPVAPAPAPVTPVYPAYAPHGGGFPLIPLFFGLLFLFVIIKVARRAAWAHNGPGSYGGPSGWGRGSRRSGHGWYGATWEADPPRPREDREPNPARAQWSDGMSKARDFWNARDVPPMFDEMFQRWHSRIHGEPMRPDQGEPAKSDQPDESSLNLPPIDPPSDASA